MPDTSTNTYRVCFYEAGGKAQVQITSESGFYSSPATDTLAADVVLQLL